MIQEGINGVCMALADSVPGVSGGTIAFIMGFYDHFIASINNVVFGKKEEKTEAAEYPGTLFSSHPEGKDHEAAQYR